MSLIKDLQKAIKIILESKSPLEKAREEFYSYKKIKWLEKFSTHTSFDYSEWHSAGKYLLNNCGIIPTISNLYELNYTACRNNMKPSDFLGMYK